jgi:nitroreductase
VDFAEVVRRRRMVRRFSDEPVPPEALERILDTGRRGPSAGYSQGVEFVVVTQAARRAEVARIVANRETAAETLARVPVHIVVCTSAEIYRARYRQPDKLRVRGSASDDVLWQVPFWHVDAGCAMMLLLLAAVNEGLSAGFIGVWRQPELRALLAIPDEYAITGVVLLGHRAADEAPQGSILARRRRPFDEVVHRERW